MAEIIFEVATCHLLSTTHVSKSLILLKTYKELKKNDKIDYNQRALNVVKFFRNIRYIPKIIQKSFSKCLHGSNGDNNLSYIVENIDNLKFGTRDFYDLNKRYWMDESFCPFKPIVEIFKQCSKYEIKVGALCGFHVIGKIKFDDIGKFDESVIMQNGINQLKFDKKGIFSKLRCFCGMN